MEYREYCPEVKFIPTQEESEDISDEDQYTHTFGARRKYKSFEEDKPGYIAIALLILRAFEELKKVAIRLDYLYATVFRTGFGSTSIYSSTIHLGLFYEIVLADSSILVIFKND